MCGGELPVAVELIPGSPVSSATEPDIVAASGQLVRRITAGDLSVELRWPAGEQPRYADSAAPPDPPSLLGLSQGGTTSADAVEMYLPDDAVLRVTSLGSAAEGCAEVEFVLADGEGRRDRFAWDTTAALDLDDPGWRSPARSLAPLVARSIAAPAPIEAVPCHNPNGDAPPNQFGSVDQSPLPAPADALAAFLATPEARRFAQAGYLELPVGQDRYVYGAPLDLGEGDVDETRFVGLVTVDRQPEGWAVTSWTSSGC